MKCTTHIFYLLQAKTWFMTFWLFNCFTLKHLQESINGWIIKCMSTAMFLCYLLSNCVYPKSIQIQYWSCSVSSSNINNFLAPRPLCLPCWPLLYFMIIILSTDRVSHKWFSTLFWLFSRLPEFLQRSILPFFNSPGDKDSKTHCIIFQKKKHYEFWWYWREIRQFKQKSAFLY